MIIYIDGLLFLNFFIDFLLIMTTSIILKRNAKLFRIILGAFLGSLSILILFFKINKIELFILKFYLGFLMCIVSLGYKNIKYFLTNFFTLYTVSIILGGFLYYLNIEMSYENKNLLFYSNKKSISLIFICIVSTIILYLYTKQMKKYKKIINSTYKVNIYIENKLLKLNGFIDSGNSLKFKGKYVIITNIKNNFKEKKYLLPFNTINGTGLMEVIKVRKVEIIGLGTFENIYLGFSKNLKSQYDLLLNGGMIC